MTSTNLNQLIDSVARRMTDADPPTDLHGRVLARLDERAGSQWIWKWMPAAVAVLAVVAIAVALGRRSPAAVPSAATERSAAVTPAASAIPAARPSDTLDEGPRHDAAVVSRVSDVDAAWQTRALPALSQPDALTMDGIQPELLAIRPLETRPLVIAPIGADEDRF